MRPRRIGGAVLIGIILTLGACGGGGDQVSTERPLTATEAATLAGAQLANLGAGGARFELHTTNTVTRDNLSMQGEVDWVNHRGRAQVTASGAEQGVVEVVWDLGAIAERRSDMAPFLAEMGYAPTTWIARPGSPGDRQLDRVIAILSGLASKERDNAILIQQKEGSVFLRTDTLRERTVDVLRYGKQTVYWVDATTSELWRFEGNNSVFTLPVVIDFIERGPRTIALPTRDEAIPVDAIREAYAAVRGG